MGLVCKSGLMGISLALLDEAVCPGTTWKPEVDAAAVDITSFFGTDSAFVFDLVDPSFPGVPPGSAALAEAAPKENPAFPPPPPAAAAGVAGVAPRAEVLEVSAEPPPPKENPPAPPFPPAVVGAAAGVCVSRPNLQSGPEPGCGALRAEVCFAETSAYRRGAFREKTKGN